MQKMPQNMKSWIAIFIIAITYFLTACIVFKEQVENRINMEICPLCNTEVHK